MKIVLLSGGSGKRLWPLSNDSRSKQFLKLLQNEEGQLESMVQRVWRQLSAVGLQDSVVLSTSKSQIDMIQSQVGPGTPCITEPSRRDTFSAISLATSYLHSFNIASPDEVIVVLPVDPFVEDRFFESIKGLSGALQESNANIALMGVTPTIPSSKYGYILPENGRSVNEFYKVSKFIEKPDTETATKLIQQGAYWNCGVFAFKVSYLLNILKDKGLPVEFQKMMDNFDEMPKISFDYEVVEKAENVVMLPYTGYWKDLGTWNTLTEEIQTHVIGNGCVSQDSVNTHLVNELDIPVVVLGAQNLLVAASPDGILITEKEASVRVKDLLSEFDRRPMFEERRWGWYRVLDFSKTSEGHEILTKRIGVTSGKNLSYQKHFYRSEVWTITTGEGLFAFEDQIYPVKAGDVLQIPVGAKHGIKAISDLEFIEVQSGTNLIEADIVRIFMTWEEVEQHCSEVYINSFMNEVAATKE